MMNRTHHLILAALTASGSERGYDLFTIKSSEKVGEFEFDYFRPQYQPGWKIKENGVEISTTSPGKAWRLLTLLLTPFCRPQSQNNI